MKIRRLDANGDPCFGHGDSDFVTDADAVYLACLLVVSMNYGEWFLDTTQGVRWWNQNGEQIMGVMPADVAFARSDIVRAILERQGVASIEFADVAFDSATRQASCAVGILTEYGQPRTITYERAT